MLLPRDLDMTQGGVRGESRDRNSGQSARIDRPTKPFGPQSRLRCWPPKVTDLRGGKGVLDPQIYWKTDL
jgi:hypothetical protein